MLGIVLIVFQILGVISSIHALMSTRTSQGTIAWLVILNTFPYLAVPAYWVLGRTRFQGYIKARKATPKLVRRFLAHLTEILEPYRVSDSQLPKIDLAAEELADLPILRGNKVELLIDGNATFDSILAGIASATKVILFQFFIIRDDEIGRTVQRALCQKAEAGVEVYVLYDEIGSRTLPRKYIETLKKSGVRISPFNTQKGRRNRFQINFRNHRKLVIVDSRTAWIGGHNVGDEYLGRSKKFGHWRDTHIRLEGPAVISTQLSFLEDWYWATDSALEMDWTPHKAQDGDQPVLIIPSGPADDLETATLMFLDAINSANSRIWIASPYFVPDDSIIDALQLAGLRGVDVRILIPDRPDHLLVYLAAFSYFAEAGSTGARFFRYKQGFLHQKTMLIDDHLCSVGTANFDNRSFRLNFELTAMVLDTEFAKTIEQMFLEDFNQSKEMEAEALNEKSLVFKLAVRLARLTSPIQ